MRVFFDTEFTGLRKDTTLVSIGMVDMTGRDFYAELTDYNREMVDTWIQENVLTGLIGKPAMQYTMGTLRSSLERWLRLYPQVELWSDCLAYDWVLFCDIFGGALNLPKNIYYIPFDLCTLMKVNNIDPDTDREKFAGAVKKEGVKGKHNALYDAYVIRACYQAIMDRKGVRHGTPGE